jgi:predicted choloylglycine hydrolase
MSILPFHIQALAFGHTRKTTTEEFLITKQNAVQSHVTDPSMLIANYSEHLLSFAVSLQEAPKYLK